MVVPIKLAKSTWRGLFTGMPVLGWVVLIQSPVSNLGFTCFRCPLC
jgi:hypothetical protein